MFKCMKDGKTQQNSRNCVTWRTTKTVYSGRRFTEIQMRFKHEGQFFFLQEEMQYTLSYFRDHGGT